MKDRRAKVVKTHPFTIKLLNETTNYVQPLIISMDSGSTAVGTSVINEKNDVLYTSEVFTRKDIKKKMTRRASYRRTRRNRKTRYREAR